MCYAVLYILVLLRTILRTVAEQGAALLTRTTIGGEQQSALCTEYFAIVSLFILSLVSPTVFGLCIVNLSLLDYPSESSRKTKFQGKKKRKKKAATTFFCFSTPRIRLCSCSIPYDSHSSPLSFAMDPLATQLSGAENTAQEAPQDPGDIANTVNDTENTAKNENAESQSQDLEVEMDNTQNAPVNGGQGDTAQDLNAPDAQPTDPPTPAKRSTGLGFLK